MIHRSVHPNRSNTHTYYPFLDAVTNRKKERLGSGCLKCRGREIIVIPEVLVIVYESAQEVNHRLVGDLAGYGSQPWSGAHGNVSQPASQYGDGKKGGK